MGILFNERFLFIFLLEVFFKLMILVSLQVLVEGLKQQAYRNINDIVEITWPVGDDTSMLLPLEGSQFSDSSLDSPLPEFPVTRPGNATAIR